MSGFIESENRRQTTLLPDRLDDYIAEESPVRVIDVYIDELDLSGLGFKTVPELTGHPGPYRSVMPVPASTYSSPSELLMKQQPNGCGVTTMNGPIWPSEESPPGRSWHKPHDPYF